MAAILVVFLLGRRIACAPGRADRRPRRRRLPALHPLDRRPVQRAAGDLHPAGGGARLPLGRDASRSDCGPGCVPGFLFGLTALIRPEYLVVGVAFVLLAAIRVGRARGWRPGLAGAALMVAAFLVPIVPWTVRNVVVLDRTVPISHRRRQGALRRHLPARRRRIPAGQGAARRALPAPRPRARLRGARRGRPDAALRPRRRGATRTCRATRRWARSARKTSTTTSAKTRSNTRR